MADSKKLKDLLLDSDGESDVPLPVPDSDFDPSALYPRDKGKAASGFRPLAPEYHFSAGLPLDQALLALETSVERANMQRRDDLRLSYEERVLDYDHARFWLRARRGTLVTAQIFGTMERWQGDRTRVDADAGPGMHPASRIAVVILGFGLVYVMLMWALRSSGPLVPALQSSMVIMMVIALLAGVFLSFSSGQHERRAKKREHAISQTELDIDLLAELLASAFKGCDVQWIEQ